MGLIWDSIKDKIGGWTTESVASNSAIATVCAVCPPLTAVVGAFKLVSIASTVWKFVGYGLTGWGLAVGVYNFFHADSRNATDESMKNRALNWLWGLNLHLHEDVELYVTRGGEVVNRKDGFSVVTKMGKFFGYYKNDLPITNTGWYMPEHKDDTMDADALKASKRKKWLLAGAIGLAVTAATAGVGFGIYKLHQRHITNNLEEEIKHKQKLIEEYNL